jgi:signal peptide peptidase SppA
MIHRILSKVFNTPWAIHPETFLAIQKALAQKIQHGKAQPPLDDDADPLDTDEPLEDIPKVPSIAIIPVFGILGKHLSGMETMCGGYDVGTLASQLKAARDDASVSAILLYFDSPGGSVIGLQETGELIASIAQTKPVYAFTDSLMCSAAYWFASQCTSVICTPSSVVGSVGIIATFLDETQANKQDGIDYNVFKSGPYKDTGAPYRTMTEDEKALIQARIDRLYGQFTAAITSKRKIDSADLKGQVFDGEQAVTKNLADGLVIDLDECLSLITKKDNKLNISRK